MFIASQYPVPRSTRDKLRKYARNYAGGKTTNLVLCPHKGRHVNIIVICQDNKRLGVNSIADEIATTAI